LNFFHFLPFLKEIIAIYPSSFSKNVVKINIFKSLKTNPLFHFYPKKAKITPL